MLLLTTLMSEVTAIVNARPIANIPTDTDDPQPLSPHTILTMNTRPLGPPSREFLPPDLYARLRWRKVQYLADQFWARWKHEYLQSLQVKRKATVIVRKGEEMKTKLRPIKELVLLVPMEEKA